MTTNTQRVKKAQDKAKAEGAERLTLTLYGEHAAVYRRLIAGRTARGAKVALIGEALMAYEKRGEPSPEEALAVLGRFVERHK